MVRENNYSRFLFLLFLRETESNTFYINDPVLMVNRLHQVYFLLIMIWQIMLSTG
jgi:hypothetical protein